MSRSIATRKLAKSASGAARASSLSSDDTATSAETRRATRSSRDDGRPDPFGSMRSL
jgi:hypothetical protein